MMSSTRVTVDTHKGGSPALSWSNELDGELGSRLGLMVRGSGLGLRVRARIRKGGWEKIG
jgi:hypothetical protein